MNSSSPRPYNILIIGGSGFVSGTMARAAVAAGHRTWVLTRGQRPLPDGVSGLVADRHDHDAFAAAIAAADTEWDLVVDCQAFSAGDIRQDVTVLSTVAKQLLYISTDFVFDPLQRSFPQPTEAPYTTADDYGGNKRRGELELLEADAGDMKWTIFRPCHIYGPGSELGCLPLHGRDPELIARMKAGKPLQLVGGGYFLQQPICARDLATMALDVIGNAAVYGEVFCTAGPDIIESKRYYEIIAAVLGVGLTVEEVRVCDALEEDPGKQPFYCHRIYDLSRLAEHGLSVPSMAIEDGLREHTESLLRTRG